MEHAKILNFTKEFEKDVQEELRLKELAEQSDQPKYDENTYIQMIRIWRNNDLKMDIEPLKPSKKGVLIAYKSKALMKENKGIKVTDLNSVVNLQPTHWTINSYFYPSVKRIKGVITGNTKEHLNQINCLPIDVDSNTVSWQTALKISKKAGLDPLCVIRTDKGYQLIYSISGACYFNKSNGETLLGVLDRVYNNVRETLINSGVPVDLHCHPYGVCRFPRKDKTVYINLKNNKTYREWIEWSSRHEVSNEKPVLALKTSGIPSWARAIVNCKSLEKGDRNVALYACALAYKDAGVDRSVALGELTEWIISMGTPVTEARRTIKSAYLDKFHPASEYYNPIIKKYNLVVEKTSSRHIDNWKESLSEQQKKAYWAHRKPAKARKDRIRSHYDEWQDDLLDWLEVHNGEKTKRSEIIRAIGIPARTLTNVLNDLENDGKIAIETKRGKYGYIIIRKVTGAEQPVEQQKAVNEHTDILLFERLPEQSSQSNSRRRLMNINYRNRGTS